MTVYIADHGPSQIDIYSTAEDPPRHIATITDYLGRTHLDDVLKLHGWVRVSAWHISDDMPPGHRIATVERPGPEDRQLDRSDVARLQRDQEAGRERRGGETP